MKTILLSIVLCVAIIASLNSLALAQGEKGSAARTVPSEGKQLTVQGKIDYMKALGGYFVRGEQPPTELIIVNPNEQVLEQLHKSDKKITIEGHLTVGADHLFIEKIDGKPYKGK